MHQLGNFTVFIVFRAAGGLFGPPEEAQRWIAPDSSYNPRLDYTKGSMGLASCVGGDPKALGWGIFLMSDGRVGSYIGPEGDTITVLSEKSALHDGDLHSVALVRDELELSVYIDGGAETKLTLHQLEVQGKIDALYMYTYTHGMCMHPHGFTLTGSLSTLSHYRHFTSSGAVSLVAKRAPSLGVCQPRIHNFRQHTHLSTAHVFNHPFTPLFSLTPLFVRFLSKSG